MSKLDSFNVFALPWEIYLRLAPNGACTALGWRLALEKMVDSLTSAAQQPIHWWGVINFDDQERPVIDVLFHGISKIADPKATITQRWESRWGRVCEIYATGDLSTTELRRTVMPRFQNDVGNESKNFQRWVEQCSSGIDTK